MTVGSVFSGVGGIDLAFLWNKHKVEWAIENDKKAVATYQSNFKTPVFVENVSTINSHKLPKVDMITGGFPCQSFSVAGNRLGFSDFRGSLIFALSKIVEVVKPSFLLLENVRGLLSCNNGEVFTTIIKMFENLGYVIKFQVLNTKHYTDIPQNRDRVFILGFKDKTFAERYVFPSKVTFIKPVTDFLLSCVPDSYYYNKRFLYFDQLQKNITKKNVFYQLRRKNEVRENKSGVCPTLLATMGTGGYNVPLIKDDLGIRKLTPRECFNFQGFPSSFILPENLSDSCLYKQAGNSVTVPLVSKIINNFNKFLF